MSARQSCNIFALFIIFATANICFGCLEHERQALIQFKNSLTTSHAPDRLSSWTGNNCCQCLGVGCNNATRHVVRLDLGTNADQLEGNELSLSLLELTHLTYLDLSGNSFGNSPVPGFIGLMTRLEYLNLSFAGFSGVVTHQLRKLSSLRVLDLRDRHVSDMGLIVDDFTWVSGLTSLEYLDLSRVNVTGAQDFDKVLFYKTPSLLELHLSNCELSNHHFDKTHLDSNLTRSGIRALYLSWNMLDGKLPIFLQNLTSLRVLDLSNNKLNSTIPFMKNIVDLNLASNGFAGIQETGVWRLCELKQLDLSFNYMEGRLTIPSECSRYGLEKLLLSENKLTGNIPTSLGRLAALKVLYLDYNLLTGTIPESIGNLTSLTELVLTGNQLTGLIPTSLGNLVLLRRLDLSENLLNGTIPFSIGRLANLEFLYLSWNSLSSIPLSIGNMSQLRFLDLSSNLLHGSVPDSLGQLSKLRFLDVSNNSLSGIVTEAHFANTSNLIHLAAISNYLLNFKISPDWKPPFQLRNIILTSCKIESIFPPWIQTQKHITILMLSNTSIYGPLPDWLYNLTIIPVLDLSHNFLNGPITNLPSNQTTKSPEPPGTFIERLVGYEIESGDSRLLLHKNNLLNGSIPDSFCNTPDIAILDLSRNSLSGNLPDCLGNFSEMYIMILSSNRLSGTIPSSLGKLKSIQWIDISKNDFHGELPNSLSNCTSLNVLDLGENRLSGSIPKWFGEKIHFLVVLRLHNNNFTGRIPEQLCQSSELQIMDFGINNLTGTIPRCFQNLNGMTGGDSNLYAFSGFEQSVFQVMGGILLEYTTIMRYVINLDLSNNNLAGEIPEGLASLSGLLGLNLSNNHLTGRIPDKIGNLSSLMSLDLSANSLSGMIPQSMSSLTFFSHLNLSYNNLSGRIPTGMQLQTLMEPWIYAGNNGLCGSPLPKSCSRVEVSAAKPQNIDRNEDDDVEKIWIYSIASGFMTGSIGILGILVLVKRWRLAFFSFWRFT
ncbi:receptor-like protein EIX1 [Bidens hawaiensis]|uniref:receptor-like protein EIX1 n=1 Tax=Bidens hawaiensis TaxID=980011 RepID=UPI0040497B53